ncbi:MAG: RagB/SusD family nutrient uptake outer membrane protein [Bacteroidetes bacterium]|nr:MAG: RagB/SusD family nutrient uptake outer membrane protein [Bacteroidota bacterium]
MKKVLLNIFLVLGVAALMTSCSEESLEPSMAQVKIVEGSINTVEDVQGILYGAYDRMTQHEYYGRDFIIYGEIRADNAFANGNSGRFTNVGRMKMTTTDAFATGTWTAIYEVIASANIVINVDPEAIEGNANQLKHYKGEAYAIRALAHFDLLKLFGQMHVTGGNNAGIPYITEYKAKDQLPPRNTVDEVKTNIYSDIASAMSMMSESLNDPSHCYMSTWGAQALKSRVALYFGDWNDVIAAAEAVINSGEYVIIPKDEFIGSWVKKGSANSIFELAYSTTDNNNINGLSQIYRGAAYGDIQVLEDLQTIFDEDDVRADTAYMIGLGAETGLLRNKGKYPSADYSDNINLIRYEEVILNYAEALLESGQAPLALTQLNLITAARGADPWTEATKENILTERRRELCFEGFRHDDLARNGMDIPLVSPFEQTHGGPAYGAYSFAFPIPQSEMNANSSISQNKGYD